MAHRNVGFRGRYRWKVHFNLIDRKSIAVVVVVNLESPQFLLLIYIIFQFRSEEMAKGVLGEGLEGISSEILRWYRVQG
jgi:hypothetical protein